MGGIAHSIGGIEDHVHLFLTLGPNHTLSMVMKQLKGESSKWAKAELGLRNFAWQEGYGVFTVSASNYAGVNRYVLNQERRHRKTTFQDEYVAMLKKGLVEYDERYLW
jgi:putative transposase